MTQLKQKYECYWRITLAYSNINSIKFRTTLKTIVDFINCNDVSKYSSKLYKRLQIEVSSINNLKGTSLRKSINQYVKLGFIYSELKGYPEDTKEFLNSKTNRRRRILFSKIVYSYSSFNRSIKLNSDQKEINFLINTLEYVGKLSKNDIAALMNISDLTVYHKGYVSRKELEVVIKKINKTDFLRRKYNQVSYLIGILKKLDDLVYKDGYLYFLEDLENIPVKMNFKSKRNSYLQKIYKNQLIFETKAKLDFVGCMLEKLEYPVLIASHIRPYSKCDEISAFDFNNGLLLSKNMDSLFDLGYISFKDNGSILISDKLSFNLIEYLKKFKLDNIFLNDNRKKYLLYHRKNVFIEK